MLTSKLITFLVGLLLLLPFAISFWLMAFRNEDAEAKLKQIYDEAMADMKAQHGANEEPIGVFISTRVTMTLPKVPHQVWSFFPRRWVGIVGLLCVSIMTVLWILSSFVPSLTYSGDFKSTSSPESITSPINTQE